MNILSRYSFISNFNAEKISKQEANLNGVGENSFKKCDTNGDGNISIDEILANQEVCENIIQAIQIKIDKLANEESAIKAAANKDNKQAGKFDVKEGQVNIFGKEDNQQGQFKFAA